jgi:hypothetical protein
VLWGVLHGLLLCLNHLANHYFPRLRVPAVVSLPAVFLVVTLLWVPFRAVHLDASLAYWGKLAELDAIGPALAAWWRALPAASSLQLGSWLYDDFGLLWAAAIFLALPLVWFAPNSGEMAIRLEAWITRGTVARGWLLAGAGVLLGLLFALSLLVMNMHAPARFIYFQF